MARLIEALYKLRDNRTDIVSLAMLGLAEDKDFRWMSGQWKKLVLVKPLGKGRAEAVHRRYFELAVMHAVKDDLKSGDLFIKYGEPAGWPSTVPLFQFVRSYSFSPWLVVNPGCA